VGIGSQIAYWNRSWLEKMEPYIQENHEMVFERVVGEDVDELYCPICGRRIQVQWSPDFRKTVLTPGNENAIHTAARGGPAAGNLPSPGYEHTAPALADPARLADWERWLQDIGFDRWWQ
jgi:hypothetical protein